jgi:hypothetical protein
LTSSAVSKEAVAREIAAKDRITEGLVCVLSAVEPWYSFDVYRDRATHRIELVARWRKCLFLYHYWMHPTLGFLHARLQTWLPFPIQVCLNGREWLTRQLDAAGIAYHRHDNCLPWVADWARAQQLLDAQLQTAWPALLDRFAAALNPAHADLFRAYPLPYYWSTYQSDGPSMWPFARRLRCGGCIRACSSTPSPPWAAPISCGSSAGRRRTAQSRGRFAAS